jgi:hypothetical protein
MNDTLSQDLKSGVEVMLSIHVLNEGFDAKAIAKMRGAVGPPEMQPPDDSVESISKRAFLKNRFQKFFVCVTSIVLNAFDWLVVASWWAIRIVAKKIIVLWRFWK